MKRPIKAVFTGLSMWLGLSLGCAGGAEAALTRVNLPTVLDHVTVQASHAASGNPAEYAIDGNARTAWDSGVTASLNSPCWITVDLGDIYQLSRVTLQRATAGQRKNYTVSISEDGLHWIPILPKGGSSAGLQQVLAGAAQGAQAAPLQAQYVRYEVFGGRSNKTARLGEMKILGDPTPQQKQVPIPAAGWLMGSGAALVGALRRFTVLKSA
jgi:hypothetical protein